MCFLVVIGSVGMFEDEGVTIRPFIHNRLNKLTATAKS